MGKCKKNFLYINSNFGLVHKIKTLFIFLIFWFFFDFFWSWRQLCFFEQFFECFTWCAKNISLRVIKVWNIVFDEEVVGSYVFHFFDFFFCFSFREFFFQNFQWHHCHGIFFVFFFVVKWNKIIKVEGGG